MGAPTSICIAIDGPVASGKTVVGRGVAGRLGFRFLDTGVIYRAATLAALQRGVDLKDRPALTEMAGSIEIRLVGEAGERLVLDGVDVSDKLREPRVERGVSLVSKVPGVRSVLVARQRALASDGEIVMVGRDIGTVVLPDAPVKIFLTASVEVRAHRRYEETMSPGDSSTYESVVAELESRDKMDSEREQSPLRAAADAVVVATDDMNIPELTAEILRVAKSKGIRPIVSDCASDATASTS